MMMLGVMSDMQMMVMAMSRSLEDKGAKGNDDASLRLKHISSWGMTRRTLQSVKALCLQVPVHGHEHADVSRQELSRHQLNETDTTAVSTSTSSSSSSSPEPQISRHEYKAR